MGEEIEPFTAAAVKAIEGVAPEIYKDGLQPMVKEVGKGLELVAKTVNACLLPLRGLVWSSEKIADYLDSAVTKRLADVPPENIQPPDPAIAGPAMEALRFTGNNEELRSMFASLIAMSMNSATADKAHPGFIEIIKQLSSDEGMLLDSISKKNFFFYVSDIVTSSLESETKTGYLAPRYVTNLAIQAGCTHPNSFPFYLENLLRLNLIEKERYVYHPEHYPAENHLEYVKLVIKQLEKDNAKDVADKGFMRMRFVPNPLQLMKVTVFGSRFIASCVNPDWSDLAWFKTQMTNQ